MISWNHMPGTINMIASEERMQTKSCNHGNDAYTRVNRWSVIAIQTPKQKRVTDVYWCAADKYWNTLSTLVRIPSLTTDGSFVARNPRLSRTKAGRGQKSIPMFSKGTRKRIVDARRCQCSGIIHWNQILTANQAQRQSCLWFWEKGVLALSSWQ